MSREVTIKIIFEVLLYIFGGLYEKSFSKYLGNIFLTLISRKTNLKGFLKLRIQFITDLVKIQNMAAQRNIKHYTYGVDKSVPECLTTVNNKWEHGKHLPV